MGLPPVIEIVPWVSPSRVCLAVPGSKSVTNRALILAALARGRVVLRGALWSEDTQVMVDCLKALGFVVSVEDDPAEPCNRRIFTEGRGGVVPAGGSWDQPKELFVGNAGTAARFLAAFVALGRGVYRLHGVPRMHERPQADLFAALRQLGCEVRSEAANEKLPVRICPPPRPVPASLARCSVSLGKSSQFASALLLCARDGGWQVDVLGENEEESSYVALTRELVSVFPAEGGEFLVEADASSGSYFVGAGMLFSSASTTVPEPLVRVANWPASGWQIDEAFPRVISERMPGLQPLTGDAQPARGAAISRQRDLGDSIMTAIVLAPFAAAPARFTDLARLRVQECERVAALRVELTRCGAVVAEEGESLTVLPGPLHGAEIQTYNDHRMAMCFAILGLKVPGIRLQNPSCVKKTFPDFFQKLAAVPPRGLGVSILDARNGQPLSVDDLFAA